MKKILVLFAFLLIIGESKSQQNKYDVIFSKFKLEWFSVMGMRGGSDGQRLKITFKNTSEEVLKYVKVYYWAVNAVDDIVTDRFNRREFSVNCTGPFKKNKWNKLEVDIALFHPTLLKAYPHRLEITHMDGEVEEIEINKENLSLIFPKIEYINIDNQE